MIGKTACALLLLFALCRAEDVDNYDLNGDIEAARAKVKAISENSVMIVSQANGQIKEATNYLNISITRYLMEGKAIINSTVTRISDTTRKFVGEAIDKNKPLSTFKCILKVNGEMGKMIEDGAETTVACFMGVFKRHIDELYSQQNQLEMIQTATVGLFDTIYESLPNCTTSNKVAEYVQRAEVRENNLKKLVRTYTERCSDLRIQYNEGQLDCIRSAQGFSDNAVRICSNKMKAC